MLAKPARDAAAKAKMEAEAPSTEEVPLHEENEWNIRCLMILFLFICMCVREDSKHLSVEIDLIPDLLGCNHLCKGPNSIKPRFFLEILAFTFSDALLLNFQCC